MTLLQPSLFAPPPAASLALRPYQEEAVAATEAYWRGGGRRALIALPTGTGKTVLFSEVLRRNLRGRRALVIAHREELLDQAAAAITRGGVPTAVEQADRRAGGAAVVVASIQTLTASAGKRLRQFPRDEIGVVVIDEAHHATARTYLQVLHAYGLAPDPGVFGSDAARGSRRTAIDRFTPDADAPLLLGVTATPSRADKVGLEAAFDEIVYSRTIREMIDAGWLCAVRGVRVETTTSLDSVTVNHGDFAERELERTVNTDERNALIVAAYHDHAPGRQAIVFAAGVAHAEALAAAFRAAGVPADWVSGAHDRWERRGVIEAYRRGELRVLANCAVLTEGFDAPETGCIVMARPTRSSTLYTQMIGRGTRLADGKADVVVIDLVDAYAKAGLASAAALFGLPPRYNDRQDGGQPEAPDLHQMAMRFEGEIERLGLPVSALGDVRDWDDVRRVAAEIDPLQVAALDPVLRSVARYTWLTASWGYYLAVPPERGHADGTPGRPGGQLGVVVNQLGQGTVRWKLRGEAPVTLERAETVEGAIRWAEEWVDTEHGHARAIVDGAAPWRKRPASEAQIGLLRRLRVPVREGLTAGQASALIEQAMAQRGESGRRR